MKQLSLIFCIVSFFALLSCNRAQITRTDTETSGIAEIVADESFAPIIDQQIMVFEALNSEAYITPVYASEAEAYDLFMKDSVQLIFGTRELTANELQTLKDRKQKARTQIIAVDGVALIVNKANSDTLITVNDLKRIMTGEIRSWKDLNPKSNLGEIAVSFDSPKSSIVRYIKDSVCGGQPLGDNVKARSADLISYDLDSITPNQKVIDFVASTPNALGIIGVNWISNPGDSTNLSFIDKIRVMSVTNESKAFSDNTYKPFPYQLALKKYPLRRDLYVIISDVRGGLPSGFVKFVAGDQGQRIILKSGLYPGTSPTRLVRINATAN